MRAARAHHESRLAQPRDHLLQVREWEPLASAIAFRAGRLLGRLAPSSTISRTPYSAFEEKIIGLYPTRAVGISPPACGLIPSIHVGRGGYPPPWPPVACRRGATAGPQGRLGIDTEFMSEGRYRALLCLVQIAVDDPEPGRRPDRADRRPRRRGRDAARRAAGRSGDRDRASRRPPGRRRSSAGRGRPRSTTSSTPSSRPGLSARAPRPVTATCSAPSSAGASARPPATPVGTRGP